MNQNFPINLSYRCVPGKRLTLFSELKAGCAKTEYVGGFRLKFAEGMITGYGSSEGKAHCTYTKTVEPAMRLEFNSSINFKA